MPKFKIASMPKNPLFFFDINQYEKASKLMQKLRDANYQYLEKETKCWIIMQEGYMLMLNKNYLDAEKN